MATPAPAHRYGRTDRLIHRAGRVEPDRAGSRLPFRAKDLLATAAGPATALACGEAAGDTEHTHTGDRTTGVHVGARRAVHRSTHGSRRRSPQWRSGTADAEQSSTPITWRAPGGQRDAQQGAQGRVTRQAHREYRQQPCTRPARQLLDHGFDLPVQTGRAECLPECRHSKHYTTRALYEQLIPVARIFDSLQFAPTIQVCLYLRDGDRGRDGNHIKCRRADFESQPTIGFYVDVDQHIDRSTP